MTTGEVDQHMSTGEDRVREIRFPRLDQGMVEGDLVEWMVNIGDTIIADQPLCIIETDKVSTEILSPIAGVVLETREPAGSTVKVGQVIAVVGDAQPLGDRSASIPEMLGGTEPDSHSEPPARREVDEPTVTRVLAPTEMLSAHIRLPIERSQGARPHRLSPRDRVQRVIGTPLGTFSRGLEHSDSLGSTHTPTGAGVWTSAAFHTSWFDLDMTKLSIAASTPGPWSVQLLAGFLKAVVLAAQSEPRICTHIDESGSCRAMPADVNVGLVGSGDRILRPRIVDVARKNVSEIQAEIVVIADSCQSGKLSLSHLQTGGLSVETLGSAGVDSYTPVALPSQAVSLGMGRVKPGDRRRMTLGVTGDSRCLNGINVARFVDRLSTILDSPNLIVD